MKVGQCEEVILQARAWSLAVPGLALYIAGVAQLVEHHLAKVDVASSNLVSRSTIRPLRWAFFISYTYPTH